MRRAPRRHERDEPPDAFRVDLKKLDLSPGAPVRTRTLADSEVHAGQGSARFAPAEPFRVLPAQPPA
ncbi:hypothetical protein [Ancylobacter terrae]|uniref:hypothetical protein n=1 Tax=Ancylobacter sp. sgz301288 TaxID=3342077 RepID=UPI00385FAC94